jgi:hypothetical protein
MMLLVNKYGEIKTSEQRCEKKNPERPRRQKSRRVATFDKAIYAKH